MKRKFIVGILMALSISITGCTKVENEINKEVIVIDEDTKETIEKNKNLALNLKFQGYIEFEKYEEGKEKKSEQEQELYYFLDDILFRFRFVETRGNHMPQFGVRNIVKTEMRKLDLNSRNEDITVGEWTELDIDGVLLSMGLSEVREQKIAKDNKVYKLLSDGSLEEIKVYSDIYRRPSYEEYLNPKIDVIYLEGENNIGIIKVEEDDYFEIRNTDKIEGIYENHFRVFEAEDNKVYIFSKKPIGEEYELVIGYVENNKFFNLFENENFTIINQDGSNLSYESVIKNNNKILFPGIIDNVNGIWNYDMETKKLVLQVELEEKTKTDAIRISPDKDTLIIENYHEENGIINSLARVNENLEIEGIIDITEKDKIMIFDKFSTDGKKIYFNYFNEEENKRVYEIYEITN